MSNQALSLIGRLDRREESLVLNQQQEQAFLQRLMGNRGTRLASKLFGTKRVRDVYVAGVRRQCGQTGAVKLMLYVLILQ